MQWGRRCPKPVPAPLRVNPGTPNQHPHPRAPGLSNSQGRCEGWTAPSTWACGLGGPCGGPQCRLCPACRARRAAKEAKEAPAQPAPEKVKVEVKKFVKIGRPGYKGNSVWGRSGPQPCDPQPCP